MKVNIDVQFAIMAEELKTLKKKEHKSKSKTSSSKRYQSDSENEKPERDSMRAAEYYQPDPYHHHRKERKSKEVRVKLSHFHRSNDIDTFLDWEMKVEQLFECYHVSEERKVPLATLSFQVHVLHWWIALVRDKSLHHEPTIAYWNNLKSALRRRHIPSCYHRELMDKLHRLNQKNISIEEYRQKMELYMIRVEIREDEIVTVAKFLSGLSLEIRDRVELLPYRDFHELVQICIKVEQVLRQGTSRSSYSNSYSKTNYEREGKSLKEKPRENPTKAIVLENSKKREKHERKQEPLSKTEPDIEFSPKQTSCEKLSEPFSGA